MNLLHQYPTEILHQIFLHLLADDVKNLIEDPVLAPFYRQCRYKNVKLIGEPDFGHWSEKALEQGWIHNRIFPLFAEVNRDWFPSKLMSLQVGDVFALSTVPEKCLQQFGHVDVGSTLAADQFLFISHLENIRTLRFHGQNRGLKIPKFPKNILILSLEVSGDFPIPLQLIELEMCYESLSTLPPFPPNLKRLSLKWLFSADRHEEHMELIPIQDGDSVDLLNLQNLQVLTFDGPLDRISLPLSITTLSCNMKFSQLTDLTFLKRLKKVKLFKSSGNIILPRSVTDLVYLNGKLEEITDVQHLPLLESFEVRRCILRCPQILDLKYPASLKRIHLADLIVSKCGSLFIAANSEIFSFNHLPDKLELFRLDLLEGRSFMGRQLVLDSKINWPNSLKTIYLRSLRGFHNTDGQFVDDLKWPAKLNSLSLLEIPITLFRDTHWSELSELMFLEVSGIGDFSGVNSTPLATTQSELPSTMKKVKLSSQTLIPNMQWFIQMPALTTLILSNCTISICEPILELPDTIRVLQIKNCKLTSGQWNKFVCPAQLERLNLEENGLDLFNFSIISDYLQELRLRGNLISPESLPFWKSACEHLPMLSTGWEFETYVRVADLGGVYTVEKKIWQGSKSMRSQNPITRIVTIVTSKDKMTIYEDNGEKGLEFSLG